MKKIVGLFLLIVVVFGCSSNKMILADGAAYKLKLAPNGFPNAASNEWAKSTMSGATLEFEELDGSKVAYTAWNLGFTRISNDLQFVKISEVSREKEIVLVEKEELDNESDFTFLSLDKKLANRDDSSWLFESNNTLRIFKYEFFDNEGNIKIFYQPTVVNEANKKTLLTFMAIKLK